MVIKYRPKVGEILECDFGRWQEANGKPDYDRNLEPEMRKRRMVTVLNGNIDGKSVVVAPISSTKGYGRLAMFHVYLSPDLIPKTYFYDVRERWVKTEHTCCVSIDRLFNILNNGKRVDVCLPSEVITEIQKAVLAAVSGKRIIDEYEKKIKQLENR